MTIVLLLIPVISEAAFLTAEYANAAEKRAWNKKRLLVNLIELAAFAVMLILPDIDLSFRFLGLASLLILRVLLAGIGCMIGRKNTQQKKKSGKIMSMVLSIMLTASAMIPAFMFRNYKGRPLSGSYTPEMFSAILTDKSRTEQFETDGSAREIPVYIFCPAESEDIRDHSLPLVIFSHGAFGWYQSNMSAYQELASSGYVVVSMEHPYHSLFTHDTSGKLITVDGQFMQNALTIGNSEASDTLREEIFRTECEWMQLREADMNFTVDTLKAAASANDFSAWTYTNGTAEQISEALRLADTEKIGLMGHSLGGATAVTVGRRADISAVIDIDGTMIGEQTDFKNGNYVINEEPYTTPLLAIDSEAHRIDRQECLKTGYVYANNVILDNAETAYSTYVVGAGHMNFTDLPLISPFLAAKLGTGEVDPEICTDTMNTLILNFFDCFLKNQGEFSVEEHY